MTLRGKKGREELSGLAFRGDYLQQAPNGRYIILRGKYRGSYADTVPRGYVRKFVLVKWIDDLTEDEQAIFEKLGRKDEDNE